MAKNVITSADIENAISLNKKEIEIDENSIVTGIAREEAEKKGIVFKYKNVESKKNIQEAPNQLPYDKKDTNINGLSQNFRELETDKKLKEIYFKINFLEEKINLINNDKKNIRKNDEELDLVIKNGFCVIPGSGLIRADLGIKDGKITHIGNNINTPSKELFDATNLCILPGIIDPHIHLGIFEDFEIELETETRAAIIGGITTAGCFFGGQESYLKNFPIKRKLIKEKSYIDIVPHFVISNYQQLEEIPRYIKEFGVKTFKLYMCGIPGLISDVDDAFMLDVFEVIKESMEDCTVFIHAENPILVNRATKKFWGNDGPELKKWELTHPEMAEEEAVIRASYYAEKIGVKIYFVHISTKGAINALKKIKTSGKQTIFAETTSPYLTLTTDDNLGVIGKMIPPLRGNEHVEALWQGIKDGIIDTIGTDNVTLTLKEKKVSEGIWMAMPGYPALTTHLPSILHEGVNKGKLSLEKLTELMCKNPARILGLYPKKGTILPGSDADLVIVDLNKKMKVEHSFLGSRSDFSIYEGKELIGWPIATIKSGKVIVNNMKIITQ
ncbi:dihydroorotase [Thermovenabulum sp.]|uniref:dihydroorotase n=1 Tax=Thermovenabulum sp. TaxID=3100335 RepID=UPI003C7EBC51